MNNDKDFANDPLFRDLRKFASKQTGPETMPAELFAAFRDAKATKVRSKWIGRSVIGVLFASVALPSLAAAHVLPAPVENIIHRVVHVVSAPVRVVASVVTSDPIPTTSPTPTPTNSADPVTPPAPVTPAPTTAPVVPTPKQSHNEVEHKSEGAKKESGKSEEKSSEVKNSEGESESAAAPKLPTKGSTSAPSVGGSSGEKREGSSSSKSESKSGGSDD